MKNYLKKYILFLPSIFWMIFIFYLSAQSTTGIGHTYNERFLILKTFHLIEYAVLAILLFVAIKKYNTTIVIAYLYAISDEIHQRLVPGRLGQFRDTLIDLIGIIIGIFLVKIIYRFYTTRRKIY